MKDKKYRIFLRSAGVFVLLAVVIFFSCFRITSVKVTGNQNYTDEEIKKMILTGPLASNSILVMMLNPDEKTKDAEFIREAKIVRTSRSSIEIRVKEKQLIGYIRYLDGYLYFDREGIVQVSTTEAKEGIPYIEGVIPSYVRIGEKIPDLKDEKLNLILSVTKMLDKGGQAPDRLILDEELQLILYYGNVEVRLGTDTNMEEKMNRLLGILPQLNGMSGILHLENITQSSKTVSFEDLSPVSQQADSAEEEDQGEQNLTEDELPAEEYQEEEYQDEDYQDDTQTSDGGEEEIGTDAESDMSGE